jgi:Leucine-rich repeat (LRR) protein
MKAKYILLNLFFSFFTALPSKVMGQCNTTRAQDSTSLVQFYSFTNGKEWAVTWDLNKPMNTWFGIKLNANGRVIELVMPNNNVAGPLPTTLANVCNLQVLSLYSTFPYNSSSNRLFGSLPTQVDQLKALTDFTVFGTGLSGQIPRFASTSLLNLDLGKNQFSGAFPNLDSCFNLATLRLSENRINGAIPAAFGNTHPFLKFLEASNNQLSGPIPPEIGRCRSLLILNLSYNQLTSIPDEIANIWDQQSLRTSLRELFLNNNALSGPIPAYFGKLFQLRVLNLSNNQLSGVIPPRLDSLKALELIILVNNRLTGSLPTTLGNMPNLRFLDLTSNQLSGTIPASISGDSALFGLYLGFNRLTGGLPATMGNMKNLNTIYAPNNLLNLSLPPSLFGATNLQAVYLENNQITGSIPPQYEVLDNLEYFKISNNQLTGTVPLELSKCRRLAYLDVANNRFDSLPNLSSGFLRYLESGFNRGLITGQNKFTFDDILPNLPLQTKPSFSYQYQGQDLVICPSKTVNVSMGETYKIDLKIDGAVTTNVYKWFKDNKLIDRTNVNQLTLKDIQPCESGTYSCQITNPAVPSLTLTCPNQVFIVAQPFQSCAPYEITTFPNPVETTLNITIVSPPDDVRMMRLSNMLGQVIWSRRFDEGDIINGLSIDCSNFPNGSYFLSLYTEGEVLSLTKRVQVLKK